MDICNRYKGRGVIKKINKICLFFPKELDYLHSFDVKKEIGIMITIDIYRLEIPSFQPPNMYPIITIIDHFLFKF